MYNSNQPNASELPSTKQLIRSTIIAVMAAAVILIAVILPAEYGIDPTGAGKALGLVEMGEIKMQLEQEAGKDHSSARPDQIDDSFGSAFVERVLAFLFVSPAAAQTMPSTWTDEVRFDLSPGQGTEIKLVMKKAQIAEYAWVSENGKANYDLHADGGGNKKSYKKGRGVTGDEGTLEAAFDGNHGWFWRNRDKQTITIILRVRGAYSEIKKDL